MQYVVIKANKMLGYIISVARDLCQNALYKALVLPILEYGQPVWHIYTSTLVDKLEKVQRRATRIILGQRRMEMDYDNGLKLLNWSSLNSRIKLLLISYVMKALYGFITCDIVRRDISVSGRHTETVRFDHRRARTQRLHCSAVNVFARYWDELPDSLRSGVVELSFRGWANSLRCHVCY